MSLTTTWIGHDNLIEMLDGRKNLYFLIRDGMKFLLQPLKKAPTTIQYENLGSLMI